MRKGRAVGIAASLALLLLGGGATAALGRAHPSGAHHARARDSRRGREHARGSSSARTVRVDDHASLRLVKYAGAVMIEEGQASGTLPGHTWVRLLVSSKVSARFSIHARSGTIEGSGGASLKSSGRYASFAGWLSVSGGKGSYAHAHGKGRLYGVIDRRTHTLTVTTVGSLEY